MSDNAQALASLRFLSRWGFLLIGIPALLAALGVGYIVGKSAQDGYSEVIAASACSVVDSVLDVEDLDETVEADKERRLNSVVLASNEANALRGMRLANPDGLVVYSTKPDESGRTLDTCGASQGALAGETHAEIVDASGLARGEGRLIKVCAPLMIGDSATPAGFLVAVESYDKVWPAVRKTAGTAAATILGAAFMAFLGLQVVVRRSIGQIEREQANTLRLNERLAESATDMEAQALGTLQALLSAVDAKDSYTATHSLHVAELALAIDCHVADPVNTTRLERAALLHDIGKIGVSESILSKPSKLTESEWQAMRDHPGSGATILAAVPFMEGVVDAIRHHHERWDGKGYPDGLEGKEIPMESRILAIADSYDAMTTRRPYSKALTPDAARAEIMKCAGTQFDPDVVAAFLRAYDAEEIRSDESGLLS